MSIDPAELQTISKAKLAKAYLDLGAKEEEIVAEKVEVRAEILRRMKLDGEVWGEYQVTKVTKPNYKKVTIEKARELGAIAEAIDTKILAKLRAKGVDIGLKDTDYSVYPLVKLVEGVTE